MADKSSFTKDEWAILLQSVMTAGIAVTAAEPSGLWGMLKESFASGNALLKAKKDSASSPLIKAIVTDFETSDGRTTARDALKEKFKGLKAAEIKGKCIDTLRQAAAIADAKAPSEATAFKQWLHQISEHVAEAATEGGGIFGGGIPVSEAEKATLNEISSVLKLAA